MSQSTPPNNEVAPLDGAKNCSRCGSEVPGDDVRAGRAVTKGDRLLCSECVEYLRNLRREKDGSRETSHLERLSTELHNLIRLLGSERFSIWNILGGIAQATALFCVAMALVDPGNQIRLSWAILMQLMALTFFTAARK